jgi:hypothetical protein
MHPNPEDIDKSLTYFFEVDQCLICHDEVMEALDQNQHGTLKVPEPELYKSCLNCHDPHAQVPIMEENGL